MRAEARERFNYAAGVTRSLPLIVTHASERAPPTGSTTGHTSGSYKPHVFCMTESVLD